MNQDFLIEVQQLSRSYGNYRAVDNLSFSVKRGEILGFLGPNGAGKSTSMQMLTGVLAPTRGQVIINGYDIKPKQAKKTLGFLPENPPLYPDLTVDEYLSLSAKLRNVAKSEIKSAVSNAKTRCGLENSTNKLIQNLSKGYQQRVGIAQAIIHNPDIIILDEPTSGLDPIQIQEIRDLIRELGNDHSVLLSTHILSEVQSLCDRVLIINKGKKVIDQKLNEINADIEYIDVGFRQSPTTDELANIPGISSVDCFDEHHFRLHFKNDDVTNALTQASINNNWDLYKLNPQGDSLETLFLKLDQDEEVNL